MDCFSKEQLPIINKLAEEFVLCDNWFSSLPGPTTPNRFFLLAATSGGLIANPSLDSFSNEDIISGVFGGIKFENGHIFDELDSKCKDWLVFSGDEFPNSLLLDGMPLEQLNLVTGRIRSMNTFEQFVQDPNFDGKFEFIEPKYNGGSIFNPTIGDYICGDSMHPLDDVTRGEKLIKRVYETIRNSPHWEKSVLIITFDEHGGFYDHVAPPQAIPPGDLVSFNEGRIQFKFDQLGPRVPALVISPLVKKGVIDSNIYDHTSVLSTIRKLYGLNSLTKRDKNANDLLHLFSLKEARTDTPSVLPNAAEPGFVCSEDYGILNDLLVFIEDLSMAKKRGHYQDQKIEDFTLSDSELGFSWIALLKVITPMKYKERKLWVEKFKSIETSVDAAQFRAYATLKVKFNKDLVVSKLENLE